MGILQLFPQEGSRAGPSTSCSKIGLSGSYTIERELGRGGMATVFLAHDIKHDRSVALKVLHPELAAALGGDRFLREIRIAAHLQHPHILTLIDSGEIAGRPQGASPVLCHAVRRGREPAAAAHPRTDPVAGRRGADPPGCARRARTGARAGHRPSRHQAREHHAVRAPCAGGRFRYRAGRHRRRGGRRCRVAPSRPSVSRSAPRPTCRPSRPPASPPSTLAPTSTRSA